MALAARVPTLPEEAVDAMAVGQVVARAPETIVERATRPSVLLAVGRAVVADVDDETTEAATATPAYAAAGLATRPRLVTGPATSTVAVTRTFPQATAVGARPVRPVVDAAPPNAVARPFPKARPPTTVTARPSRLPTAVGRQVAPVHVVTTY